ncbi:MAG: hypothetical protein ABJL64_16040 [Rhizobiaceae bacterium]
MAWSYSVNVRFWKVGRELSLLVNGRTLTKCSLDSIFIKVWKVRNPVIRHLANRSAANGRFREMKREF